MNTLYYGDNLDVMRRYIKDDTVDLVYLDPPFKSNQDYNVLFAEQDGKRSAAQIKAFGDTWRWDQAAAAAFEEIVEHGGRVSQVMQAFRTFLSESDMLAYLAMMAPRLVELRRALKSTGSIYLHCDPTASHYLKMLMDAVFDPAQFKNQISWRRSNTKGDYLQGATNWPRVTDVILYYAADASDHTTFNQQFATYSEAYLDTKYRYSDPDGRLYRLSDLSAPGAGSRGHPRYDFMGITRYWRYNKEKMTALFNAGRIVQTKPGTVPQYKRYLDDMPGVSVGDFWDDIDPINSQAQERLGYPTQKPEALLKRIIRSSSNEGDTVLDPFCGCGTAIAVAELLGRAWIGIDITHLAISLIRHRLYDAYGDKVTPYKVIGEPVSLPDAEALAEQDKFQFQAWSLGLVGARVAGPGEQKKGADKGIDGRLYFHDEPEGGKTKQIILSVKGGNLKAPDVRDLRGVIEREQAELGVLISLEEPTKSMRTEAASAGFYDSPGYSKKYPRLQLLTVAELLGGKKIDYPPHGNVTFKKAAKAKGKGTEQLSLAAEPMAEYDPDSN